MKWKNNWFVTVLFALLMSVLFVPQRAKADFCYYSVGYWESYPLGVTNSPTVIQYGEGDANPAMMMITVLDQSPTCVVTTKWDFLNGDHVIGSSQETAVTGNPYPQVVKFVDTGVLCNYDMAMKRYWLYIRRASDNALVYQGRVSFIY